MLLTSGKIKHVIWYFGVSFIGLMIVLFFLTHNCFFMNGWWIFFGAFSESFGVTIWLFLVKFSFWVSRAWQMTSIKKKFNWFCVPKINPTWFWWIENIPMLPRGSLCSTFAELALCLAFYLLLVCFPLSILKSHWWLLL